MIRRRTAAVVSAIIAGSIALGVTACSKPSAGKLKDVVIDELDAEEYTLEDIMELEEKDERKITKAAEDGIVIVTSGEEIDDLYGKDIREAKKGLIDDGNEVADSLNVDPDDFGLDIEDWDADDLGDVTVYIRMDGDFGDDMDILFAAVIEFEDKDKINDLYGNFMDGLEETLDKEYDIDVAGFDRDEYQNNGKNGHIVFNLDNDTLVDVLVEMYKGLYQSDGNESLSKQDIMSIRNELEDLFGDLNIAGAVYYDNGVLTVVFGMSEDLEDLETICTKIGLKSPLKVENSEEFIDSFSNLGSVMQYSRSLL